MPRATARTDLPGPNGRQGFLAIGTTGVVLSRVHPASPVRLTPHVHTLAAADTVCASRISIVKIQRIMNLHRVDQK